MTTRRPVRGGGGSVRDEEPSAPSAAQQAFLGGVLSSMLGNLLTPIVSDVVVPAGKRLVESVLGGAGASHAFDPAAAAYVPYITPVRPAFTALDMALAKVSEPIEPMPEESFWDVITSVATAALPVITTVGRAALPVLAEVAKNALGGGASSAAPMSASSAAAASAAPPGIPQEGWLDIVKFVVTKVVVPTVGPIISGLAGQDFKVPTGAKGDLYLNKVVDAVHRHMSTVGPFGVRPGRTVPVPVIGDDSDGVDDDGNNGFGGYETKGESRSRGGGASSAPAPTAQPAQFWGFLLPLATTLIPEAVKFVANKIGGRGSSSVAPDGVGPIAEESFLSDKMLPWLKEQAGKVVTQTLIPMLADKAVTLVNQVVGAKAAQAFAAAPSGGRPSSTALVPAASTTVASGITVAIRRDGDIIISIPRA